MESEQDERNSVVNEKIEYGTEGEEIEKTVQVPKVVSESSEKTVEEHSVSGENSAAEIPQGVPRSEERSANTQEFSIEENESVRESPTGDVTNNNPTLSHASAEVSDPPEITMKSEAFLVLNQGETAESKKSPSHESRKMMISSLKTEFSTPKHSVTSKKLFLNHQRKDQETSASKLSDTTATKSNCSTSVLDNQGNDTSLTLQEDSQLRKRKVLRKKKERYSGSVSSVRTASPETLPIQRLAHQRPRQVNTVSQTEPLMECLLLPRPTQQPGHEREIATSLSKSFNGEMPPVLIPLDRFGLRPGEEAPADVSEEELLAAAMDVHAKCEREAPDQAAVDAHVTYRKPSSQHGATWRVDIDGVGLQLIVDLTDDAKKTKQKPPKKIKREIFSFWPKKYKVKFTPSVRRHLQWLKDEAEEKHVSRVQRAACMPQQQEQEQTRPRRSWSTPPSNMYREIKRDIRLEEKQHVARLQRARDKAHHHRVIAPRPHEIPPPFVLPTRSKPELYEDERAARIRDARDFYSSLSASNKLNVAIVASRQPRS